MKVLSVKDVINCPQHIIHMDPAHILGAGPQFSAQSELRGQQQFFQGAPQRIQCNADPQVYGANSLCISRTGRLLPETAYFGNKIISLAALLGHPCCAAIAVVPNG